MGFHLASVKRIICVGIEKSAECIIEFDAKPGNYSKFITDIAETLCEYTCCSTENWLWWRKIPSKPEHMWEMSIKMYYAQRDLALMLTNETVPCEI